MQSPSCDLFSGCAVQDALNLFIMPVYVFIMHEYVFVVPVYVFVMHEYVFVVPVYVFVMPA